MKITGQQPTSVPEAKPSRETAAASQARTAQTSGASEGEDRVELSPLARALQTLRAEVGDPEAIDAERVAELRTAIGNGTYDPPAHDVADALLRELSANRIV
jgi:negative regulator of flagellin synthesis FlgM